MIISLWIATINAMWLNVFLCLMVDLFFVVPVLCFAAVDQELSFQDKYLFYRFLDDETEEAPLPSEEEQKESDEELQDTLLLLSQIGPDAHLRMILRKLYVLPQKHQRLLI